MDASETPAPTAAPGPGRKELKIVIVGDGGCGKTSLLMVYSQGSFPEVRPSGVPEAGRLRGSGSGPLGTRACTPSPDPGSPASCSGKVGRFPGGLPWEFQSPGGGGAELDGATVESGEESSWTPGPRHIPKNQPDSFIYSITPHPYSRNTRPA